MAKEPTQAELDKAQKLSDARCSGDTSNLIVSMCFYCKNLWPGLLTDEGLTRCTAYPDGIPTDIRDGRIDHQENWQGDHGVKFAERGAGLPERHPFYRGKTSQQK